MPLALIACIVVFELLQSNTALKNLGPWVPGPPVLGSLGPGSLGPGSLGPWSSGPGSSVYSVPLGEDLDFQLQTQSSKFACFFLHSLFVSCFGLQWNAL